MTALRTFLSIFGWSPPTGTTIANVAHLGGYRSFREKETDLIYRTRYLARSNRTIPSVFEWQYSFRGTGGGDTDWGFW